MESVIACIPVFLCWGSFLNVVSYRLIHYNSLLPSTRCHCPQCKTTIAWYDLIPVVSWLCLRGKCRLCSQSISVLYPCIELLTAILFVLLYIHTPHTYFISYALFFSALIVTIRSDIETMLISQIVTLYLAPIGFVLSFFGYLPVVLGESIFGAVAGYLLLYSINAVYRLIRKQDGIGEGDFDLLALIGAFTGFSGCWASITMGSALGTLCALLYLPYSWLRSETTTEESEAVKIPFGPFLALGAIIFVFCQNPIHRYFELF